MSKARKQQSGEKLDSAEIFADDDFDAEEFVEHMDDKAAQQRTQSRGGWRRLEELREQKMLRSQLLELEDWDEFK